MSPRPCTFCRYVGTTAAPRWGWVSMAVGEVRRVFCGTCWLTYFHRFRAPAPVHDQGP